MNKEEIKRLEQRFFVEFGCLFMISVSFVNDFSTLCKSFDKMYGVMLIMGISGAIIQPELRTCR